MVEKIGNFPRINMFEDVQHLVASFFTSGSYYTEYDDITRSILNVYEDKNYREFYLSLFLMSLASHLKKVRNFINEILNNIKAQRKSFKVYSEDTIKGNLDIDEYIRLNKIDRVYPHVYPSNIKKSTYQIPEYQITLKIIDHLYSIISSAFNELGITEAQLLNILQDFSEYLLKIKKQLRRNYGIYYSNKETYVRLKKQVDQRYRNRNLITPVFQNLIRIYESIISIKSIDFNSLKKVEMVLFNSNFDDRLFEIWLLKKVAELVYEEFHASNIQYNPLYKSRKECTPAVIITVGNTAFEIWFQNRKELLDKSNIKWFYMDRNGNKIKLSAIPDIVVVKRDMCTNTIVDSPVLIDAKNREWTFDGDMASIKPEIDHLVYIKDNFGWFFQPRFNAILVAHNQDGYKERTFFHEDNNSDQIKIISLQLTKENVGNIDSNYLISILDYLR